MVKPGSHPIYTFLGDLLGDETAYYAVHTLMMPTWSRVAFLAQGKRQPVEYTQGYHMDRAARYRIRLNGYVSARLASNYGEMSATVIKTDDGRTETELAGRVTDQAALVGLINMLYDLGHAVVAVERIESDEPDVQDEPDELDQPDEPDEPDALELEP